MGCVSSKSEIISSCISEIIYIHQFFTGIIKPHWQLNKFNEYSTFYKYNLTSIIQNSIKDKLKIFLNDPRHLAILNRLEMSPPSETVHLSLALGLSLAQHIFGMEQKYLVYRENFITEFYFRKYETRLLSDTITGINSENYINPNTENPQEIKILETRLKDTILKSVENYDLDRHFEIIILNMLAVISDEIQRM